MSLKEYVVTSNDIQCKESLCAQMEEDRGNDCVPQRKVKTEKSFKKNRITTFLLHKKEAEALKKDPRVKAVEPVDIFDRHKITPVFEQSGNFKKNYSDACALEAYPWMSQTQSKEYITSVANENHITDEIQSYSGTGAPITNWDDTNYGLWGAPNRLAKFRLERGVSGKVYPSDKYFLKKSAGMTYPKRKIRSSV